MKINSFVDMVKQHSDFRRHSINLIASENHSSPLVRAMLASDLGNRYSADFYGGTTIIRKIIDKTASFIRELFNSDYAFVTPLSGNFCVMGLVLSLTKSKDKIMVVETGGYPFDYYFFNRQPIYFPFKEEDMNINIEESITLIKKVHPKLVIFGSSTIPLPHPVKEIVNEFERKKIINFAYDASHVLGLIAGKQFQKPLDEGAQVLIGSTHKSFPGPQGGVILTNDIMKYDFLAPTVELDLDKGIRLIDNCHVNRIAGLGVAALEMMEFGQDYANQIIKNSKTLAKTLDKNGVPVKCKTKGFTESHQVILDYSKDFDIFGFKNQAEKFGLIVDAGGRIGTAEITRMGMKELEAKEIGEMLAQIYLDQDLATIPRKVHDLTTLFSKPLYCFENLDELNI